MLGCQPPTSRLCLCFHMVFSSVCVCVTPATPTGHQYDLILTNPVCKAPVSKGPTCGFRWGWVWGRCLPGTEAMPARALTCLLVRASAGLPQ